MIQKLLLPLILVVALASCATQKEISYMQDYTAEQEFSYSQGRDITLECDDMISIVVSSKNPELVSMLNLPKIQSIVGAKSGVSSSNGELSGYTIDSQGYIDFPVLGRIDIAGQTREEVTNTIKSALIDNEIVNDPVVTVNFVNLKFYVLGEVASPGGYSIDRSRTTILEALSLAGDLTIYGMRDRVTLTRNIGDKKVTYRLDLRSQDIYQSPAFYVQQNDVIYVEPNRVRANQSTVNGNTVSSAPFWISIASFMTTLTLLFIN